MSRQPERPVVWIVSCLVGVLFAVVAVDADLALSPGIWFPLIVLTLLLGLRLAGRRCGVHARRSDDWLGLAALAPAVLVGVFADVFLFVVNLVAAFVALGVVAAAYGGKLTLRQVVLDPVGIGLRAWGRALPQLGVGESLRRGAIGRPIAGLGVAVLTVLAAFEAIKLIVAFDNLLLGAAIALAVVAFAAWRLARGWFHVALNLPSGAGDAVSDDTLQVGAAAARRAPGGVPSALAAVLLAWMCVSLTIHLLGSNPFIVTNDMSVYRHLGSAPVIVINQGLAALAALAGLAAITLATVLAPGAAPGAPHRGRARPFVGGVAVLSALALVGVTARTVLSYDALARRGTIELEPVIAEVRMGVVLCFIGAALAWRLYCVLRDDAVGFGIGSGLLAAGFVVAANVAHPDLTVPGRFGVDDLYPHAFSTNLSDDAVPWGVTLLGDARWRGRWANGAPAEVVVDEFDRRRAAWLDAGPVQRVLRSSVSSWYARRAVDRRLGIVRAAADGTDAPLVIEPTGVAVAPDGTVYVADDLGDRIVHFGTDGTVLRVLGGSGSGRGDLLHPADVAVSPSGEVVVADAGNARVQRYDASGNPLGAWSVDAQPGALSGIAVAADGTVWLSDRKTDRVVSLGADGRPLNASRGGGYLGESAPTFHAIAAVPSSAGSYYVLTCDSEDAHVPPRLVRVEPDGRRTPLAEVPTGEPADLWCGGRHWDLAVSRDGRAIFVLEHSAQTVSRFAPDGSLRARWPLVRDGAAASDSSVAVEPQPGAIARAERIAAADADALYLVDRDSARIVRTDGAGRPVATIEEVDWETIPGLRYGREPIELRRPVWSPSDIAVAPGGDLLVTDRSGQRVVTYAPDGRLLSTWSTRPSDGKDATVDLVAAAADGTVYAFGSSLRTVLRFGADGAWLGPATAGGYGSADGEFDQPTDLAVADDGSFAVLEHDRIQWFARTGELVRTVGTTHGARRRLYRPEDVAVASDGTAYVAGDDQVTAIGRDATIGTSWGRDGSTMPIPELRARTTVAIAADGRIFAEGPWSDNGACTIVATDPQRTVIGDRWTFAIGEVDRVTDIALAPDGTLYVADAQHHTIWRASPDSRVLERVWRGALPVR